MSKININELIRIAKENKDKIYKGELATALDEATKFTLTFEIKEGKNKILAALIYRAYESWSPRPISKLAFFRQFAQLFEAQKSEHKTHYNLNYKPGELINEVEKRKENKES